MNCIKQRKEITYGEGITYQDSSGTEQKLSVATAVGTKIGSTTVDGQSLNWYLFDVSDDGKTAYLVSTPTYWVPDTTNEVRGAYTPKLVSAYDENTGAIRQAIQKKASGTAYNKYTYSSGSVTYKPSDNTLNYYKSANRDWAKSENGRSTIEFSKWYENEQAACYLYDEDIFARIKNQVNSADGNLKGKIETLVGGASVEQWCKAYNRQSAASSYKITCEYSTSKYPGYIYRINGSRSTVSNNFYYTGDNTLYGNDIYGAARKNGNTSSSNPFFSSWWLASPSSGSSYSVCYVNGNYAQLDSFSSNYCSFRVSLFARVAL